MLLPPIWRQTFGQHPLRVKNYKNEELECQDEELRKEIIVWVQLGVAQNLNLKGINISRN
jgi:hypothetical protein